MYLKRVMLFHDRLRKKDDKAIWQNTDNGEKRIGHI